MNIMSRFVYISVLLGILFGATVVLHSTAYAEGGDSTGTDPNPPGTVIALPNPLRAKTFQEFLDRLIDVLITFGIPLFALMVALSAIYFITAGDSPQRRTTAKNILKYAIIGFLILISSRAIMSLVKGFL